MTRRFLGDPVANASSLIDEIDNLVGSRGPQPGDATRLINLGTLELYRTWQWRSAFEICSAYRETLVDRGLGDPEDLGSVTLNLARLHASVGDFDNAVVALSQLLTHAEAQPSVCRELMNAALTCNRNDVPRVADSLGLRGAEAELVKTHTELVNSRTLSVSPKAGTRGLADLWGLEILLLSALIDGDLSAAKAYAGSAIEAARNGTAGVGALMAIERAATTYQRQVSGRRVAPDEILLQIVDDLAAAAAGCGVESLRLRAITIGLQAGRQFPDAGELLRLAAGVGLPRDFVRLLMALSTFAPEEVAVEARKMLATMSLDPLPAELAGVALPPPGGWDGLSASGRWVMTQLADRLTILVASVA